MRFLQGEMVPCCLGENLGDCNKTCVQTTGLKSLADFTEEERKVLLWRGGKKVCVTDAHKLYICYHRLSKLGRIFEKRFTRFTCCNLFKTQKRNVKGGHKISLQLATKLLDHRYDCIPGWQLCRTCYDITQKIEKNVGNEMSQLSMNHRKLISWILRQPIIQLAILIQLKQENNQEKIEQRSSVYWRHTHQNTQHAKALQSVL